MCAGGYQRLFSDAQVPPIDGPITFVAPELPEETLLEVILLFISYGLVLRLCSSFCCTSAARTFCDSCVSVNIWGRGGTREKLEIVCYMYRRSIEVGVQKDLLSSCDSFERKIPAVLRVKNSVIIFTEVGVHLDRYCLGLLFSIGR
jgi:hypothetical protein